MAALTVLAFVSLLLPALVTSIAPAPSPPHLCTCPSQLSPLDSHASGFYPVTMVLPPDPNATSPTFYVSVTFFPNNEHDSDDDEFTPLPPQLVNLTLDSSCNQIILPVQDCYRLRLQDTCAERSISCNATPAVCGSSNGETVYPSQTLLKLSYNSSLPLPSSMTETALPLLCSSARDKGVAGIAPYRLSLVVNVHRRLEPALHLHKTFGYCLGKPQGYFFVGQPNYVFSNSTTSNAATTMASMTSIPTLRWDEDALPVLRLTSMVVHGGDEFGNVTAPMDASVFAHGLGIGTGGRYLSLIDPAYHWLRETMAAMANASSLTPVPSPIHELDLCYALVPGMTIDGPLLELRFGDTSWMMDPMNFLVVTPGRVVCLGAVNSGSYMSSLGTLAQEEVIVEYNFEDQMVGLSGYLPRVGTRCGELSFPKFKNEINLKR